MRRRQLTPPEPANVAGIKPVKMMMFLFFKW